jgi:hypothetical protein
MNIALPIKIWAAAVGATSILGPASSRTAAAAATKNPCNWPTSFRSLLLLLLLLLLQLQRQLLQKLGMCRIWKALQLW